MTNSQTVDQELALYRSIQAVLQQRSHRHRLLHFGVEPDDAAHEIWIRLTPYIRRTRIRNIDAFVNAWVRRLMHRVIDQAARYNRKLDPREVK